MPRPLASQELPRRIFRRLLEECARQKGKPQRKASAVAATLQTGDVEQTVGLRQVDR
jgi:hypothetical protein